MKNLYLYTPEICDGDYCPIDCDICDKADEVLETMEGDDEQWQTLNQA